VIAECVGESTGERATGIRVQEPAGQRRFGDSSVSIIARQEPGEGTNREQQHVLRIERIDAGAEFVEEDPRPESFATDELPEIVAGELLSGDSAPVEIYPKEAGARQIRHPRQLSRRRK